MQPEIEPRFSEHGLSELRTFELDQIRMRVGRMRLQPTTPGSWELHQVISLSLTPNPLNVHRIPFRSISTSTFQTL